MSPTNHISSAQWPPCWTVPIQSIPIIANSSISFRGPAFFSVAWEVAGREKGEAGQEMRRIIAFISSKLYLLGGIVGMM